MFDDYDSNHLDDLIEENGKLKDTVSANNTIIGRITTENAMLKKEIEELKNTRRRCDNMEAQYQAARNKTIEDLEFELGSAYAVIKQQAEKVSGYAAELNELAGRLEKHRLRPWRKN